MKKGHVGRHQRKLGQRKEGWVRVFKIDRLNERETWAIKTPKIRVLRVGGGRGGWPETCTSNARSLGKHELGDARTEEKTETANGLGDRIRKRDWKGELTHDRDGTKGIR